MVWAILGQVRPPSDRDDDLIQSTSISIILFLISLNPHLKNEKSLVCIPFPYICYYKHVTQVFTGEQHIYQAKLYTRLVLTNFTTLAALGPLGPGPCGPGPWVLGSSPWAPGPRRPWRPSPLALAPWPRGPGPWGPWALGPWALALGPWPLGPWARAPVILGSKPEHIQARAVCSKRPNCAPTTF